MIDEEAGTQIIHYLCHYGKIKGIKTVIEILNANINATDYRGQTPLHFACISGEI
jgi:ankyrin repeat protein